MFEHFKHIFNDIWYDHILIEFQHTLIYKMYFCIFIWMNVLIQHFLDVQGIQFNSKTKLLSYFGMSIY